MVLVPDKWLTAVDAIERRPANRLFLNAAFGRRLAPTTARFCQGDRAFQRNSVGNETR
jgi:hypothetical protein